MKKLVAITIVLVFISWGFGAGNCGFSELFALLRGAEVSPTAKSILLNLRLPRLLAAFFCGGMLAAAGAASQNLFRNDLASPHILGVINSAALGAIIGMLLNPHLQITLSIIFGISSLLLFILPGERNNWETASLILAGIAINAFCSALSSGILFLADERLNSMIFWLLGGFWRSTWSDVYLLATAALPCWLLLYKLSDELDLMLLGDRTAFSSGVKLRRTKILILLSIAILSAVAVSCCGVIGFIGLAVPHICRFFTAANFKKLLPAAIFTGASLLLVADLLARKLAAPQEIPVGIFTAFCGAPFFFYLIIRRNRSNAL